MTRTGKCDTCRLRKVKCDEQKPKCTACHKSDRDCTYSFGKVSAFVIEDPTQHVSKHGKSKFAPTIYPLEASPVSNPPSTAHSSVSTISNSPALSSESLRQSTETDADDGKGVFMTFSLPSRTKLKGIQKTSAQQKRKLRLHLQQLQDTNSLLVPRRLTSDNTVLAARYLSLLGSRPAEQQPFAMLGSFIQSIPSRIGHNATVDLAVEYLVHSFDVYRVPDFSNTRTALATKARALKALQMAIGDKKTHSTYDTAIAMKMHFMAEIFMGVKNLYHAIHAAGLSDILQFGPLSQLDDDHFWDFLDNTYIDDVAEALVTSRTSMYDSDIYIQMTSPAAIPSDSTAAFRLSAIIMHIFIQLPRLVCLIRHASNYRRDSRTLDSAVCLSEYLWVVLPVDVFEEVYQASVTVTNTPPSPDIADIVSDSYHFDSVRSCLLISRYWTLQVVLSAIIQTLYREFPTECSSTLLPPLSVAQDTDIEAAFNLARCIPYSLYVCPSLPLIPLRVYTSFQVSIGTWYRIICRLTTPENDLATSSPEISAQLSNAQRMEDWVCNSSNGVHQSWNIQRINKKMLRASAVNMAGGPIPDWLPLRIKFEYEDGEPVMKMEYDIGSKIHREIMQVPEGEAPIGWVKRTKTMSPFHPETDNWVPRKGFPDGPKGKMPAISEILEDEQNEPLPAATRSCLGQVLRS